LDVQLQTSVLLGLGILGCVQIAAAQNTGFRVVVVEGEGSINNIVQRTMREPVVRVEDDMRPVAGAVVTFTLPTSGAGAASGGQTTMMVTTGADGVAAARGLRPNSVSGPFQIRVLASHQGRTARAIINQTNAAPAVTEAPAIRKKWLIIAGAVAGGAAAGVIFATRGKSGAAPSEGTLIFPGITAGAPSFRPPQ
jgi:hypothetical protein